MNLKKSLSVYLLLAITMAVLYTGCGKNENTKAPTESPKQITIYVSGNVASPGQYTVTGGSTIKEAIQLAGGLLPDADTAKFNLNEIIEDTLYIHIPSKNLTILSDSPTQGKPNNNNNNNMTTLELKMTEWVNYERTSRGLQPLSSDMELVNAARLKSQDLIDNNYFDHQSPLYGSPADLLLSQGIKFNCAGENLAKVATLERGHSGLMNSPGHRENILRPEFGKIGIGIIDRGRFGLMITQEFTD